MKRFRLSKNNWDEAIQKATKVLNEGGLVIYPTETCYGIAVDATNRRALAKLLAYKTFRGSKPISIAVSSKEMAQRYVLLNEMAENIYKNYLPGPITVISLGSGNLESPVLSKQGSVGVRIPDYKFTLRLIENFGRPITATSANVSYKPHPYSIDQLLKDLPKKSERLVDMYIDVGELPKNIPSTVVDTTMNTLTVLREGKQRFEDALVESELLEEVVTKSAQQTSDLGCRFAEKYLKDLKGAVIVALSGELGSGKTQLAKGLAKCLGVDELVNSPTYTIINEYRYGDKVLAHMDTWRLMDEQEFERSGLLEHIRKNNVVVIEWADKFYNELSEISRREKVEMYKVVFKYISLDEREIKIYGTK
ncbi:MAG: L-threonylcarbamoyladenylate synthase [Candidatus Dojkabacteria bacterium]|jgi:L-threonylcarbamoyladenylate synthase